MSDTAACFRKGEKGVVRGSATVATGTLTIQTDPAATCTLYDSGGNIVDGFSGVAVTGQDNAAASLVSVWYNLDTGGLTPGRYTLSFYFSALRSADGLKTVHRPAASLFVRRYWD